MPRYYCDYCDTYLTHDSPSVRKQHNAGYKHKANVRTYYQQFEEQQTQSLIDQRIKEHLGKTAAYQQVGAAYNQHLASFPQRPHFPVLPMQGPGQIPINSPVLGIRTPVLPRPITSAPGYGSGPMMPSMVVPPGSSPLSMQFNGLPRPSTMNPPTTVPGGMPTSASNGALSMMTQTVYQGNPAALVGGVFDNYNTNVSSGLQRSPRTTAVSTNTDSEDGFAYSQASESNH